MTKITLPILILLMILPGISSARCIKGNCKNGEGVYLFPDGSRYKGMFKNSRIEGDGTFEYADKNTYIGSFIGGTPHGQGLIKYSDTTTYQGSFDRGIMSGTGILNSSDGSRYEGGFSNGLFHGMGIFTFPDGRKYEGTFKSDLFDGQGTLTTDESILTVHYEEGKCVGTGTITFLKDNTTLKGECIDGEFVYTKKIPLPQTETAADTEKKPEKAAGEFEFKIYEPENFHKEPAALDFSVPPNFNESTQPPPDQFPVPEYIEPGTNSQGKM